MCWVYVWTYCGYPALEALKGRRNTVRALTLKAPATAWKSRLKTGALLVAKSWNFITFIVAFIAVLFGIYPESFSNIFPFLGRSILYNYYNLMPKNRKRKSKPVSRLGKALRLSPRASSASNPFRQPITPSIMSSALCP